jgi:hypothetical protein
MQTITQRKAYYERNKEKLKEKSRLYRLANPEKAKAQRAKYRASVTPEQRLRWRLSLRMRDPNSHKLSNLKYYNSNKEKYFAYKLKNTYGLTLDEYYELVRKQKGLCAICGGKPNVVKGKSKRLNIDHNHSTGKVRGLLCNKCNNGIGCFNDNTKNIAAAISYLKHYDPNTI